MFITEHEFYETCVRPFGSLNWIYSIDRGYIVWRRGTGDNVELLHIRTFEKRKGYGRQLFSEMLCRLKRKPPYHSVFGFTRSTNDEAQKFYGALGFNLSPSIDGLYRDGDSILFWQSFGELCRVDRTYLSRPGS